MSNLIEKVKECLLQRHGEEYFTKTKMKDLIPYNELLDVQKAAVKVLETIKEGKVIGLYADYDTDGVTSISCLGTFLESINANVQYYQPNRFIQGYGLHSDIIKKMKDEGVDLVITLDCGISNYEASLEIEKLKMDLIVTDHHTDGKDDLPVAVAVVNPKRRDQGDKNGLQNLAGVGVAFYLCMAINDNMKKPKKLDFLLDYVAVGTIGDLVKIDVNNALLIRLGMENIKKGSSSQGIVELLNLGKKNMRYFSSEDISFFISPVLNAKGRTGSPDLARKVLMTKNKNEAHEGAKTLIKINEERKSIQKKTQQKALEIVSNMKIELSDVLIISSEDFHEGVMGIVASKIKDLYQRPVLIFSKGEVKSKGSCRSFGGVDLYSLLKEHEDLFLSFGGHKEAAGLSITNENLEILRSRLSGLKLDFKDSEKETIEVDDPKEINLNFLNAYNKLGPFGMGNPSFLFKIKSKVNGVSMMKDIHAKFAIISKGNAFDVVSFNYLTGNQVVDTQTGIKKPISYVGSDCFFKVTPLLNEFRGKKSVTLVAESIEQDKEEFVFDF